jgi:leucyl-tRNA synthetase
MYDHKEIENKWRERWEAGGIYKTPDLPASKKAYVLDMFPYPSGDGLHVGHPKGYIATDIYSRFKRMTGHSVLHPMGWDAFGLPAENYAIANKVHPRVAVEKNIQRFKEQLSILGLDYDWSREVNTTDPAFYKWTQVVFLKLLEKGLAYESYEPINWCPSCQTGLANEDLEGGVCERCGSAVVKKPMRQWVLKITDYAERLLSDLDKLKWPESIKESQRNWIGKSEGMLFTSPVKDTDFKIQTFSAHFEAFAADTFVVIAPDHPFLPELVRGTEKEKEILDFAKKLTLKRESLGFAQEKESEGIFTGRYIVDPVGNGDLPIWVASYALADYGTGIVKCSSHDERDFAFAKKYGITLKVVLSPEDDEIKTKVENFNVCYTDMTAGILSEPKEFKDRKAREVREDIKKYLEEKSIAVRKTTYRLNDWVFSRQRYWGEPIPVVHCEKDGVVPVPEKDLPVVLPEVESYEPTGTGESPLANIADWVNTTCPKCGGPAKRETNTMPQWAGSSWYYLRYIDPQNASEIVDKKKEKEWSPVDMYVGGAEHATRHLIYARFWHKFLFDIGAVNYDEPFSRVQNVGLILAEDGNKMSKRFGNVINPDDIVERWGADTLRVYEMFMGPFDNAVAWSTDSMVGARRFVEKIWRISENLKEDDVVELDVILNRTIKKVTEDIEEFKFNTAISAMMILSNEIEKYGIGKRQFEGFLKIFAPFAPHIAEELWHNVGNDNFIHLSEWPRFDEKILEAEMLTLAVQINSRTRGLIEVSRDASEAEVLELVMKDEKILKHLGGKSPVRVIYVAGRILNIVV